MADESDDVQWISISYDPADKVDKDLFETITQLIDSRLLASQPAKGLDKHSLIAKIVHRYRIGWGGLIDE